MEGAKIVLGTMKSADIPQTCETVFAIFKGLAIKNNTNEFLKALEKYKLDMDNKEQLLEIIEEIGKKSNKTLLTHVIIFTCVKWPNCEHCVF